MGIFEIVLVAAGALLASILAAIAGFGGAAVLLPIVVLVFGVREAIPILTVAQLIDNGSRVWFNRRQLEIPVVGWFSLGGIPSALIGGAVFVSVPLGNLKRLLGLFLLLMVGYRRMRPNQLYRLPLRRFALLGAISSFFPRFSAASVL